MKDIFLTLENTSGFSSILHLFRTVLDQDIFLVNTITELHVESQCFEMWGKMNFLDLRYSKSYLMKTKKEKKG